MTASTLVDRVRIYALSSGTGPFVLGGPVPGYRGIAALLDGATYSYAVGFDGRFEAGTALYDLGLGMLIRAPQISSNGGAAENFPANVEINFTLLAQDVRAAATASPGILLSSPVPLLLGYFYGVRSGAAPLSLTLPSLSTAPLGSWVDVGDVDFNANNNPITIIAAGSDEIVSYGSPASSQILDLAGAHARFVVNLSSWCMLV